MSRPADWTPLAAADPVPGDPVEVALLGSRLSQTAGQIKSDVAYLRSLCTDEFWDSDAGSAFHGRVNTAADRLWQAHSRYLAAGEALGISLNGPGFASALDASQALAGRALGRAQPAWTVMQQALNTLILACAGVIPYQGRPAIVGFGARPKLDAAGNPVLMVTSPKDTPEVSAAIGRYNAHAADYAVAVGQLRQAVNNRDGAAKSAASAILAAIQADGLQDPTGFLAGLESGWDDVAGWVDHNWARVVADIATVCSWLATVLGLLALVFAFIPGLQPLAAILEGAAFTLTEISLVCHLILAATGDGPWMDVGIDLISIVTFGIGRSALRGAQGTVKVANELSKAGEVARIARLWKGGEEATDFELVAEESMTAAKDAITEGAPEAVRSSPGLLGRFGKESLEDLKPVSPATVWKAGAKADWKVAFKDGVTKTLGKATRQAFSFRSPEIKESLNELREMHGVELAQKVSGIQFSANVIHYGHLWTGTQIGGLTVDTIDKIDSVVNYFGAEIPGYDSLKEHTKT